MHRMYIILLVSYRSFVTRISNFTQEFYKVYNVNIELLHFLEIHGLLQTTCHGSRTLYNYRKLY